MQNTRRLTVVHSTVCVYGGLETNYSLLLLYIILHNNYSSFYKARKVLNLVMINTSLISHQPIESFHPTQTTSAL